MASDYRKISRISIMNEKEKAEDLIKKFKPHVYCYMGSGMLTNEYDEGVAIMESKKCALVAVEEIIQLVKEMEPVVSDWRHEYWLNVKKELHGKYT